MKIKLLYLIIPVILLSAIVLFSGRAQLKKIIRDELNNSNSLTSNTNNSTYTNSNPLTNVNPITNNPANTNSGLVTTSNIIGWWKLNGNANDTIFQNNGISYNITYAADRNNNANGAAYFSGTSKIEIPHTSLFNFGTANNFTVSAWAKLDGNQVPVASLVTKGLGYGEGWGGWQAVISSSSGANNFYGEYGGQSYGVSWPSGFMTTGNLNDGSWHLFHYVVNRSASTIKLYVDGVLQLTFVNSVISNAPDSISPIRIGADRTSTCYFKGWMSDVRIYNNELSGTDISALYSAEKP